MEERERGGVEDGVADEPEGTSDGSEGPGGVEGSLEAIPTSLAKDGPEKQSPLSAIRYEVLPASVMTPVIGQPPGNAVVPVP